MVRDHYEMSTRTLCIDWLSLAGANKSKRKLHLQADDGGIYSCPVKSCLHVGFKSQRGLRKHIDNKHVILCKFAWENKNITYCINDYDFYIVIHH